MADRHSPSVVVLGSLHMDLIASAERLPGPGESVTGGTFAMAPGGKAGNQAIQVARCGLRSVLLTRLGDDLFGRELLRSIEATGVDTRYVAVDAQAATGASTVMAAEGHYMSIIAPGAAGGLSRADIDAADDAFASMDALIVQLELPAELSTYAAKKAKRLGKRVVLNASPAPRTSNDISLQLWESTAALVVNDTEAGSLLEMPVEQARSLDAAEELRDRLGIETVVVTLGRDGAVATTGNRTIVQPAFQATVVDTVGAGDAFLGVLVAELVGEESLEVALRRAAAAGALAVGHRGAYDALPERAAIDAFLDEQPDRSSQDGSTR